MKFRSATQSLVFCLVIGTAAQGWAQIQFKGRVVVNGKSGSDLTGVILPTDRTARRKFEDVQNLIDEGKYSEVTQYLGEILSGERDSELGEEDVFFATSDADGNEIYRSRKHEALRLLGSLPPEGLKWYRLQFGGRAQKLLDAAVEAGDYGGISEVARRYLHTEAGYKAALLLAQHHLDHGRPLAAARLFQQVLDSPDRRSH